MDAPPLLHRRIRYEAEPVKGLAQDVPPIAAAENITEGFHSMAPRYQSEGSSWRKR